ncbi:MAG TPA: hypothetical protein VHZ97_30100 [Pseudonocardiaceae bacterium]|nr:hypothetical protein [Pseudonocardiaceae bacterium]
MRRRNSVAAIAALGSVLFAASAFLGSAADAATAAPIPPSSCTPVYFDVNLGQGVDVICNQAQGTYQAVAQCNNGFDFWSSMGTLTVANAAPSVAICHGDLLAPAQVVSYYIIQ